MRATLLRLVFYMHGPANGKHWLERWARNTVPDKVLCNSQFTAATLPELYRGVHSEVLYCPVSSPETNDSQAERSATRAELQTTENERVIIQVSRMEAWKGHALHLEALSLLKDLPDWVCWQVGGTQNSREIQYLETLKKRAFELGIAERVRFLDQRADVPRLMAAADIFCQPNTGPEPFGIVFIEALYAGLPVVTSQLGGACEIVDDSCGMLVPPSDKQALAKALRRLIQEPSLRNRLGAGGPFRASAISGPAPQMNQFCKALSLIPEQVSA